MLASWSQEFLGGDKTTDDSKASTMTTAAGTVITSTAKLSQSQEGRPERDNPQEGADEKEPPDSQRSGAQSLTRPLYIWLFDFFRVGFKGV